MSNDGLSANRRQSDLPNTIGIFRHWVGQAVPVVWGKVSVMRPATRSMTTALTEVSDQMDGNSIWGPFAVGDIAILGYVDAVPLVALCGGLATKEAKKKEEEETFENLSRPPSCSFNVFNHL